jgi:GDP-4-dehydro-6-deoxy-D-mannose reductase
MEELIEKRFLKNTLRVRPFPHIGPGQALGFVTADFASQIAAIEKGEQDSVMKVGNLEAKRDFTDVRDVVRAYRLLLQDGELGEVYNVASGKATSIQFVLDELLKLSKVKIKVERDPERMRPSDIPVLVGDANKLKETTGWEPTINLERSLEDILNYWREGKK